MIESAEQFRKVFGDLIDEEAKKQQIYVFVIAPRPLPA